MSLDICSNPQNVPTPRVNTNVKHRLWMVIKINVGSSILTDVPLLVGNVDNGIGYDCWGQEVSGTSLHFSLNFLYTFL